MRGGSYRRINGCCQTSRLAIRAWRVSRPGATSGHHPQAVDLPLARDLALSRCKLRRPSVARKSSRLSDETWREVKARSPLSPDAAEKTVYRQ